MDQGEMINLTLHIHKPFPYKVLKMLMWVSDSVGSVPQFGGSDSKVPVTTEMHPLI